MGRAGWFDEVMRFYDRFLKGAAPGYDGPVLADRWPLEPELVELGSGTASKTRVLLDALHGAGTLLRYVPVDVVESMVRDCADELTEEYPGLLVHGVIGDFERHLDQVPPAVGPRIVAFLGGTIGNFPAAAAACCARSRTCSARRTTC